MTSSVSSFVVALAGVVLIAASACSSEPETTCEVKRSSPGIADTFPPVTCAVEGDVLTLTTALQACAGLALSCQHVSNAKAITFDVDSRACKTEGETTSSGCGEPQVLGCKGAVPAPGTYELGGSKQRLVIGLDGACSVK